MTTHYISGSGLHGCLYDHCQSHETYQEAVDDLVQLFELGSTRKQKLAQDGYLELILSPIEQRQDFTFGADYCEITKCNCATPEVHNDN